MESRYIYTPEANNLTKISNYLELVPCICHHIQGCNYSVTQWSKTVRLFLRGER